MSRPSTRSAKPEPHRHIVRQVLGNRIAHWTIALSTFALIFSGFGQMPMYARYGVASLPGMAWAADYGITLIIHYAAAIVLLGGLFFHVVFSVTRRRFTIMPRKGDLRESVLIIKAMLGRGEEPVSHKYLAEQRLAYAFIGVNLVIVTVSGLVKVVKNLPGVDLPYLLVFISTSAHNIAAVLLVLGIAGHLFAFVFKANRSLLPAMFSGCVDAEYARHRHGLWYREVASTPVAGGEGSPCLCCRRGRDGSRHKAA